MEFYDKAGFTACYAHPIIQLPESDWKKAPFIFSFPVQETLS
jgi:hypothetical protein